MRVKLLDLAKTQVFGKIVRFDNNKIPKLVEGMQRYPELTVPDNVVLTRLWTYGNDTYMLHFYDPVKNHDHDYTLVNKNVEVELIDVKIVKPDLSKFKKWCLDNLSNRLNYDGSIGTDPEMFIENEKSEIIPAFNFLPDKNKGRFFKNYEKYGKLFWDGFQAEFDVASSSCMDSLSGFIQIGLHNMLVAAREYDKTAKISLKSIIDVPRNVLENTAPEHVAFGCAPSLNIYGMKGLQASGNEVTLRTAGGHIHFGPYDSIKDLHQNPTNVVKALDAVLGIACVSMFATLDNPRRRQMYGLAGEYRLPKHGLEYRTLSNAWLCHPLIAHIVFDLARSAFMLGKRDMLKYWKGNSQETIEVINNHQVDKAREILIRNKDMFFKIVNARYKNEKKANFVVNIIMNGVESIISKPDDIENNWMLSSSNPSVYMNEGKRVSNSFELNRKV